jgi:plasmid stabilization system protein ParE
MGNSEKESLEHKTKLKIVVHREAQHEVREAFDYYEDISEGLGFEFMRSLDASLQFIERNPLAYQKIRKEVRRALLRKFPYALFYVAEENQIVIIACFHQKRSGIDWLRRI